MGVYLRGIVDGTGLKDRETPASRQSLFDKVLARNQNVRV